MKKLLFSISFFALLTGCKKTNVSVNECYACADNSGNAVLEVCGSSKDDARKNVIGPYNGTTYTYGNYPESEFNKMCKLKQ
jgi:hypothetical protein